MIGIKNCNEMYVYIQIYILAIFFNIYVHTIVRLIHYKLPVRNETQL